MSFQLTVDIRKCNGCGICELACSLYNSRACHPEKSRIRLIRYEEDGMEFGIPIVCQHCDEPFCKHVCVNKAFSRNPETGAILLNQSVCIGCRCCLNACPFGGMSFDADTGVADKCDHCGGDPKCVQLCPTGALNYDRSDKLSISKKRRDVERYLDTLKDIKCFGEVRSEK